MSESVLDQVLPFVTAFGIVAIVAGLLGGTAWLVKRGEPAFPPWRRWQSSLTGVDVFTLFVASQLIMFAWVAVFDRLAVADSFTDAPHIVPAGAGGLAGGAAFADAARLTAERRFWTGACAQAAALPTFLLFWLALRRFAVGRRSLPATTPRRFAADVLAGVLTWAVITPASFAVYFVVLWAQQQYGGVADEHPLKQAGAGDTAGRIVTFFAAACVFPAVYEELVFRRILLPWAVGPSHRPWFILVFAIALTALVSDFQVGPLAFAVLLFVGQSAVQRRYSPSGRLAVRTACGIYSTAALFGLLHSQVWPTPVPLFVFGLGVGYAAARTQSVWPAIVAHGLFNAVSAVAVLRSPGY